MSILDTRPAPTESAPWTATYLNATEAALTATNAITVLSLLESQVADLRALLANTPESVAHLAYAPGKWTLAESLLHVADTERVFAYRALRIGRGDKIPLSGFDQDAWVPESRAANRTLSDIMTEIEAVRDSSIALVRSLDDTAIQQIGTASGAAISVRALVWMMAGHFAHHLEITRTRYLATAQPD